MSSFHSRLLRHNNSLSYQSEEESKGGEGTSNGGGEGARLILKPFVFKVILCLGEGVEGSLLISGGFGARFDSSLVFRKFLLLLFAERVGGVLGHLLDLLLGGHHTLQVLHLFSDLVSQLFKRVLEAGEVNTRTLIRVGLGGGGDEGSSGKGVLHGANFILIN